MTTYTILDSLIWGFVASIPLFLGSIVALFVNLPKHIIASIMAFGSGVLIAALAFSLIEESFSLVQTIPPVIIGFIAGGLSYTIANYFLNKKSLGNTRKRKRSHGEDAGGSKNASGLALLIGSVMDNIPENMALGISLITGGVVNTVLMAAIFISNFPEGLASTEK
jgi:ZIP family zinc transporter